VTQRLFEASLDLPLDHLPERALLIGMEMISDGRVWTWEQTGQQGQTEADPPIGLV
jgi:hypothetical protein